MVDISIHRIPGRSQGAGPEKDNVSGSTPVSPEASGQTFSLKDLPCEGRSSANFALVEIVDYECPYCASHVQNVLPELRKEFISTGKLRYFSVNYPLPSHPNAKLLSVAAVCADEQHHFSAMHDALFEQQPRTRTKVLETARSIHLNADAFATCLDSFVAAKRLVNETDRAAALKVDGTPTFAIGKIDTDNSMSIKRVIFGVQSLEQFRKEITQVFDSSSE